MLKDAKCLSLLLVLFLCVACVLKPQFSSPPPPQLLLSLPPSFVPSDSISNDGVSVVNLTEKDSKSVMTLKLNQKLVIQLDSNPTTGFAWDQSETMKAVIALEQHTFQAHEKAGTQVGAGGKEVWEYKAAEPGQQVLNFNYRRSWEKGAPAKIVTFMVEVK